MNTIQISGIDYLDMLTDDMHYHPKGFHEAGAWTEISKPAAIAKPRNKA